MSKDKKLSEVGANQKIPDAIGISEATSLV
jgi:hypothetical protein